MAIQTKVTYLCGVISWENDQLVRGRVRLRNGVTVNVAPNDPGLAHIKSGRPRMIVVRDGVIWAVYNRPRIRLLRKLEKGELITEEVLELYQPRYLSLEA